MGNNKSKSRCLSNTGDRASDSTFLLAVWFRLFSRVKKKLVET